MKEHLSDMLLDQEAISREHRFTKGLGFAHLKAAEEAKDPSSHLDHLAFSATNFRRAAADALLLSDFDSAKELFVQAAHAYSMLGMPYALLMFELAGDVKRARVFWNAINEREGFTVERHDKQVSRQHVYSLMFYAAERMEKDEPHKSLPEHIWTELDSARSSPIGVLGLPVSTYLNLSSALMEDDKTKTDEALLPFLTAYSSAISQAAHTHHWRQMLLPFHPAEPDVLGVLALSHVALQHRQRSVNEILSRMPLSWQATTVIKDFLKMRFPEKGPSKGPISNKRRY